MAVDELLERIVLAFQRTLDHVMYSEPDNLLFPDLGIIAAAVGASMFVFFVFVVILFGIFGNLLPGR